MRKILEKYPKVRQLGNQIAALLIIVLMGYLIYQIGWKSRSNYDIYYMAALGKEIWKTGKLPTVNPSTIIENAKIQISQWLFCLFSYFVVNGHPWVEKMYCVVTLFVYSFLLYLLARKENPGEGRERNQNILILITVSLALFLKHSMRPMAISAILLSIETLLLMKYRETENKKWLIGLPIIGLIQVNVHAAMYLWIILYALPWCFPDKLKDCTPKKIWQQAKPILGILLITLLVSCINPYGPKGMFWLGSVPISKMRFYTAELHSIFDSNFIYKVYAGFGVLVLLLLIVQVLKGKPVVPLTLLTAGSLLMFVAFIRNLYVFPIALVLALAYLWKEWGHLKSGNGITILILLFCCLLYSGNYTRTEECFTPEEVVAYLQMENLDAIVAAPTETNSYLNAYGFKTPTNCMLEAGFIEFNGVSDIFLEHREVAESNDMELWETYLTKYGFTHLIICTDASCYWHNLPFYINAKLFVEEHPEWVAVVETEDYVLYENTSLSK